MSLLVSSIQVIVAEAIYRAKTAKARLGEEGLLRGLLLSGRRRH